MTDIVKVVSRWQRGEISGAEACQQIGERSYGDIYKLAKRCDVEILLKRRDLPAAVVGGSMTDATAAQALGSSLEDWLELEVALKAGS